jgi:pyridoxamine 5'-phosphate oxidase
MGKDTRATNLIQNLREDYRASTLEIETSEKNPLSQFRLWFEEALKAEVPEPNAMTLATASAQGMPSARIVLLKKYDEEGFVFYTNYKSRKGQELLKNPQAALVFCWLELQRQIRIEGRVEKLSKEASLTYFQSRPKSSQIGAWVSNQSQETKGDRSELEAKEAELKERFKEVEQLPLPEHWGGFRIVPENFEFWQGRTSRLHDRIFYKKDGADWEKIRLAP